jgi:hypothetical protein
MARAQTYSMEKIQAAREALRKLPARTQEKSGAQVVELLRADLRKAVKQGHSLKEIQALLAEQGIGVSLSRMASVLEPSGKGPGGKKAGKPKAEELFGMAPASRLGEESGAGKDEKGVMEDR